MACLDVWSALWTHSQLGQISIAGSDTMLVINQAWVDAIPKK